MIAKPVFGYVILAALSIFFLWDGRFLNFGSPSRMGPGFFPTILAILLLVMAMGGALKEFLRPSVGPAPGGIAEVAWKPLIYISVAVAVFASTVRVVGLVPACFLTCAMVSIADGRTSILASLILSVGVSFFAWLIFILGLGLSIPSFRMPL